MASAPCIRAAVLTKGVTALQLPYIIHGGTMVPDSHFIIKYLANTYGKEVEATVAPRKQSLGQPLA